MVASVMVANLTRAAAEPPGATPASPVTPPPQRYVLSTNAVDVTQQTYALALDVGVGPRVAVRGEVGYEDRHQFDRSVGWDYRGGMQGAFAVRGFLAETYHGPFAELELKLRRFGTSEICNSNGAGDPWSMVCDDRWTSWSPRLSVGWQSTWRFGLSLAAAVGVGYEWNSRDDGYAEYGQRLFVGALRVGYAF